MKTQITLDDVQASILHCLLTAVNNTTEMDTDAVTILHLPTNQTVFRVTPRPPADLAAVQKFLLDDSVHHKIHFKSGQIIQDDTEPLPPGATCADVEYIEVRCY